MSEGDAELFNSMWEELHPNGWTCPRCGKQCNEFLCNFLAYIEMYTGVDDE